MLSLAARIKARIRKKQDSSKVWGPGEPIEVPLGPSIHLGTKAVYCLTEWAKHQHLLPYRPHDNSRITKFDTKIDLTN